MKAFLKLFLTLFKIITLSLLIFCSSKLIIRSLPGNPVDTLLAETGTKLSRETLIQEFHLNDSYLESLQYQLKGLFHGDLGRSLITQKKVTTLLSEKIYRSFLLATVTFIVTFFCALTLAALSLRYTWALKLSQFLFLFSTSIPTAWLGVIVAFCFTVALPLFPLGQHLFLPVLTLTLHLVGYWSRILRQKLQEEYHKPYCQFLRGLGHHESKILFIYAMKPTLIQFTGLLGTYFGALLGGSFIIEMIFGWSGLGTLTLESLHRRDYPVVESALWVTSFFILFFTMMGDYLQECLTPHS